MKASDVSTLQHKLFGSDFTVLYIEKYLLLLFYILHTESLVN